MLEIFGPLARTQDLLPLSSSGIFKADDLDSDGKDALNLSIKYGLNKEIC